MINITDHFNAKKKLIGDFEIVFEQIALSKTIDCDFGKTSYILQSSNYVSLVVIDNKNLTKKIIKGIITTARQIISMKIISANYVAIFYERVNAMGKYDLSIINITNDTIIPIDLKPLNIRDGFSLGNVITDGDYIYFIVNRGTFVKSNLKGQVVLTKNLDIDKLVYCNNSIYGFSISQALKIDTSGNIIISVNRSINVDKTYSDTTGIYNYSGGTLEKINFDLQSICLYKVNSGSISIVGVMNNIFYCTETLLLSKWGEYMLNETYDLISVDLNVANHKKTPIDLSNGIPIAVDNLNNLFLFNLSPTASIQFPASNGVNKKCDFSTICLKKDTKRKLI
ncbi:hypothetical protein BD780_000226 [Clostridium tetanomorphum]|uniref:Uncharacterized protein n=1 Tax=Clostridium tetanomorphum TaxID=1553 RepID=A0A923EBQ8_CLOTT|nr:hypothetical protein [Clostridium tetanomorphum]KAJ51104.1 hypothetical protein CTM_14498 [Clostridium tetanomorphum DSM 665]MBC2398024.1 hypothetical protein [Clostridium tetanomorphum]MBP1864468.1 hypothetical protein [Clostridium tetanomorphum]NRS83001.1 hypothetical protein [Clostridium tetanomorphum]NRZ98903.1 hypothetical protein [Clostridium tetanomorphum]